MRRHLIGIIALLSLLGAGTLWTWAPQSAWSATAHAGLVKGGLVATLVWLAYADIRRLPAWLGTALVTVMVVVAIRPKTVFLAVPIIVVLAILRPRLGRRG